MSQGYSIIDRLYHIHETPLILLRHSYWWIRKTFFTRPRSEAPAFFVPLRKPALVALLGQRYFEPGWVFSYSYRGETLNLRRPEYVENDSPYEWWQTHVRGYDHPDGMELTCHFETDPSEHPDAHVNYVGLSVERGMEQLHSILEDEGVAHERVESPASSELSP